MRRHLRERDDERRFNECVWAGRLIDVSCLRIWPPPPSRPAIASQVSITTAIASQVSITSVVLS